MNTYMIETLSKYIPFIVSSRFVMQVIMKSYFNVFGLLVCLAAVLEQFLPYKYINAKLFKVKENIKDLKYSDLKQFKQTYKSMNPV